MSAYTDFNRALDVVAEDLAQVAQREGTRGGSTSAQINSLIAELARVFAMFDLKLDQIIEKLREAGDAESPDNRDMRGITPWALGNDWRSGGTGDQNQRAGYDWGEWERRRREWLKRFGR